MRRIVTVAMVLLVGIGAVGAQERSFSSASFSGFRLEWRVVGAELELRFSQQTTGWIALGFKPSRMMRDANIIIGYVADDEVVVEDHHGHRTIAHRADVELGGSSNVRLIGGEERDGRTTLHVAIPLDSGDEWDQPLFAGERVRIIYAWGRDGADETSQYHAGRGGSTIEIR